MKIKWRYKPYEPNFTWGYVGGTDPIKHTTKGGTVTFVFNPAFDMVCSGSTSLKIDQNEQTK